MGNEMILVADDNHALRASLVEHLKRRRGGEVIGVADGETALEVVQRHPNELEILISDLDMPGLDGLGLIRQTRLLCPGSKCLLISSEPGAAVGLEPPVDLLTKPFELVELDRWLDSSHARSPFSPAKAATSSTTPDGGFGTSSTRSGGHPRHEPAPWRKSTVGLAAAGIAVLLLVSYWIWGDWGGPLGPWGRSDPASDPTTLAGLPDPPSGDILRSLSVEGLQPLGIMEGVPSELLWNDTPDAAYYVVGITDVDDALIWQTRTETPMAALPEPLRREWPAHVAFYVSVDAYAGDGALLASTSGQRIRVVPKERDSSRMDDTTTEPSAQRAEAEELLP